MSKLWDTIVYGTIDMNGDGKIDYQDVIERDTFDAIEQENERIRKDYEDDDEYMDEDELEEYQDELDYDDDENDSDDYDCEDYDSDDYDCEDYDD